MSTHTLYDLAGSDTIDSRQLIARYRELERGSKLLNEDEREELAALRTICEEGEGFPDWKDGTTLIRESYFTEYAEDYADSVGLIDHDSALAPYVDWERFASDIKSDYSTIEIEGETYYGRD